MANNNCVGGIIRVTVDGSEIRAKGDYSFNPGMPKNETVMGAGYVHGYKSVPQVAYIEGAVTDNADLDIIALFGVKDATVILEMPNGKAFVLRNAYFASEGEVNSGEGEVKIRFESPFQGEFIQ